MGRGVGRLGAARTGLGAWCGSHAGEWLAARSSAWSARKSSRSMQGWKTTKVLGIEAGDAGVLVRITADPAWTAPQKAWLGGSGAEEVASEVEEGGSLSSMVGHGGGVLRFLSRERREMRQGERCEEGEKGADERRGGASAMATEGCP